MRQVLKILYQPYKWLIYLPLLVVFTVFFATLAVLLAVTFGASIGSRVAGTAWARVLGFITPMRVVVNGRERLDRKKSYVVVSNHRSHYDVLVLYGWLGLDIKWVMKQELRKVPALGAACATLGHVFIDRRNHKAALASMEAAKERLNNGASIIFFPEGTRTTDGTMRSFKKGAFRMALDLGWPILPLTVVGTRKILPSGTFDLLPGRAQLHIHDPIQVDQYDEASLNDLVEETRCVIASKLPD
jgi:1-acyl-sn-glycerol-3-phosphate acyltransferase